jgi:hypothetical protein
MRNLKMGTKQITKRSTILAAILGLVLAMSSVPATASPHKPNSSTEVPVKMVVTVKSHRGAEVPVVAEADVKVYQGNNRNAVTSWIPLQGDRAGLQLFILIDETSRQNLSLQFGSIAKFIEEQPDTTAIGVGYMRNGMVVTVQELTKDHALAAKSLRLPMGSAAGYTSPYLSLSDLMQKWPATEDRREILMITSGIDPLGGGVSNDPFNNPYLSSAFYRAQRGGFIVYSIYTPGAGVADSDRFSKNLAQSGLDLLAQKTGGETYYLALGTPLDFTPYLQDVSNSLKHQYELTFLAKGANKSALEPVKVKTEMPNTGLVTAENGYVKTGT